MSCFLRQQDNGKVFLPRISLMSMILFVIICKIRKICGNFLLSFRGRRNVSSAELNLITLESLELLPLSARQSGVVVFLPRISLMLRILFVIICKIRKICGNFLLSFRGRRNVSSAELNLITLELRDLLPLSASQLGSFFTTDSTDVTDFIRDNQLYP